jgi:hypothetical protein
VILVVDSSAPVLLVNPAANPPIDPLTNLPLEHAKARVEHLISGLSANDTIIIPAPVLAETLVRAGDGAAGILEAINGMARVKIRSFGLRAAVETAQMTHAAIQAGDKKAGSQEAWQKVKVDRQIVAIARVEGADLIYADDKGLCAFAKQLDMKVVSTWDLSEPEGATNLFTIAGLEPDGQGRGE